MVHECLHGIFFADPAYREASFELWDSLDDEEAAFWRGFFGWMHYDTGNLYLMVNELQAYLLQQPIPQAEGYFRSHRSIPALQSGPAQGAVNAVLARSGGPFRTRAEEARQMLYVAAGISIERLFCLEEAEPEG